MKSGLFVQARIASTRLERKALIPVAGVPLLRRVLESVRRVPVDVHALLTDDVSVPSFEPLARESDFVLFVGDADDVLRRYCDAAEHFRVDTIVRATGDNPLVSAKMATRILEFHRSAGADYSRFAGLPLGTGVEVVRARALLAAHKATTSPYDREHVMPYIYGHDDQFAVQIVPAPLELTETARVTIDTADDLVQVERLLALREGTGPIEIEEVVALLRRQKGAATRG